MSSELSFSDVMSRLRVGDNAAATEIFNRFTTRLVALARSRLDSHIRQKLDPEDVVQSVYKSFFRQQTGASLDVANWDGLWGLLAVITLWKCRKHVRDLCRELRDVRREQSLEPPSDRSDESWQVIAQDTTPSEAAMLVETLEELMRGMDERDRQIVSLRLQGHTEAEIGKKVKLTERTVRRVLAIARNRLQRMRAT